ncbi:MAG: hypothetical protein N3F09_08840 [Bacteroidia bacterium]|nr:hypothetical protein [Bacteroidia bacterium]
MENFLIIRKFINNLFYIFSTYYLLICQSDKINYDLNYFKYLAKNNFHFELEQEKNKIFINSHPSLFYDSAIMILGDYYINNGYFDSVFKFFKTHSFSDTNLLCISDIKLRAIDFFTKKMTISPKSFSNNCNKYKFYNEYFTLLKCGYFLYNFDYKNFDSTYIHFKNSIIDTLINKELNYLFSLRSKKIKQKSLWKAGVYSALLPGLGKAYTGNNGQAISMFLSNALFAGLTFENYKRLGKFHPQTIIFASGFIFFYAANIYGSILSVKYYNFEKMVELHHNIAFSLSIPLRYFKFY